MRDGSMQVYDLSSDPLEKQNLVDSNDGSVMQLKRVVQDWVAEHGESALSSQDDADNETLELLRSMGYIE